MILKTELQNIYAFKAKENYLKFNIFNIQLWFTRPLSMISVYLFWFQKIIGYNRSLCNGPTVHARRTRTPATSDVGSQDPSELEV